MIIPATVKIGPIVYTIAENPRFASDQLVGEIRYYQSTIELQPNMSPAMTEVGLWHEMFHAILLQGGFREHDERLLDILAHGVVRLLQDNEFLRASNA